jgi:hypothetical protein
MLAKFLQVFFERIAIVLQIRPLRPLGCTNMQYHPKSSKDSHTPIFDKEAGNGSNDGGTGAEM